MRFLIILPAVFGIALCASTGGNSQGVDAGAGAQNAAQVGQNVGGSSQNNDGGAAATNLNPMIIPAGGDSGDQDYAQAFGYIPQQSGQPNAGNNNFGGPAVVPNAGGSSNDVDPAGGNAWAAAGGNNVAPNAGANAAQYDDAETPQMTFDNYREAQGMSSSATAGVVIGVIAAVGVGAGVVIYRMKSRA